MQPGLVAAVAERAEQRPLARIGVGEQRQRLVGVGREHDMVEHVALAAPVGHRDPAADPLDPRRPRPDPDPARERLGEPRHVFAAAAHDGPPDRAAGQLQEPVIGVEAEEGRGGVVQDLRRRRRPDRARQRRVAELALRFTTLSSAWEKATLPEWMVWAIINLTPKHSRKKLRLFACWCARSTPLAGGRTTWDLMIDERSKNAIAVAERYANGKATKEELSAAWLLLGAARAAAGLLRGMLRGDAAGAAAWAAAGDAAWAAARAAAGLLRGLLGLLRGMLRGLLRGMLRGLLRGLLRVMLRRVSYEKFMAIRSKGELNDHPPDSLGCHWAVPGMLE